MLDGRSLPAVPDLLDDCPLAPALGLYIEHGGNLLEHALAVYSLPPALPYRYLLTRIWDPTKPRAVWVMCNPSTATADADDPTIRRCISFSREWDLPRIGTLGGLVVLNLFAYRATKPKILSALADPAGEHADRFLLAYTTPAVTLGGPVIAAWGNPGGLHRRGTAVRQLLHHHGVDLQHLVLNNTGEPKHPLFVLGMTGPTPLPLVQATA